LTPIPSDAISDAFATPAGGNIGAGGR
jgi:hypothetical protein